MVNPKYTLEEWTTNFADRPYYINEKDFVMSYNDAQETWSILYPYETAGENGKMLMLEANYDKKKSRVGRPAYRIEKCTAQIPPFKGWQPKDKKDKDVLPAPGMDGTKMDVEKEEA